MSRKVTVLAIGVLVLAVALQFRGAFVAAPEGVRPSLKAVLDVHPAGWEVRDLPIGETEEVRELAVSTLRYDDYFLRSYRRGGVEFTIYVAYWAPGKFPPQLIAKHTPDMCWTLNGMKCVEMRFNVTYRLEGADLWPGQWRWFRTPDGRDLYTVFWHMIGSRPYDYGTRFYDLPSPSTFWLEAVRFATGAPREQYFFRIASNVTPERLWREPGFQEAVRGFVTLGLGRRAQPPS